MKPTRRNLAILIIINLILGLIVLAIPMRFWQSQQNTIAETIIREDRLENDLEQSIENFTELEEMYNELQARNNKLEWLAGEQGWQEFEITGYSANDGEQGTNNITATTFNLDYERVKNLSIIATDPNVIPLYSIIEIEGMGAFIALDTGGKIIGNRIDVLFKTREEAIRFGVQNLFIRVIEK